MERKIGERKEGEEVGEEKNEK
jgi:hypothetical protein